MFFIGIGVSKTTLDVAMVLDAQPLKKRTRKLPNTPEGHRQLVSWCCRHTGAQVTQLHALIEATGAHHEELALALGEAGIDVSVINPGQIEDFASNLGIKTRNHAPDALNIARYGLARQGQLRP